jgi:hypothetical protein
MKTIFTLVLALIANYMTGSSYPLHSSSVSPEYGQFRSGLYAVAADASATLVDGNITQYDTGYSNNIDGKDARKLSNPGENFALIRGTAIIVVERRHTFQTNDTIFFKMWNMRPISYRLQLIAYHMNVPGRIGILKDRYLATETPVNLDDTTNIDFSVTSDPASSASDRFMVVFETPSLFVLPLTITSLSAHPGKNSVRIDWTTSNDSGMKQYKLERSFKGNDFIKINDISPKNTASNNYEAVDRTPLEGYNFYRIEGISKDERSKYSQVIKVYVGKESQGIDIFPNPVINNNFNLRMQDELPGTYEIKLMNSTGQILMRKRIEYTGGVITENCKIEQNIPRGVYHLQIKTPSGAEKRVSILF